MNDAKPKSFRSGFVSIVGRPNVGKSTLMNQLVKSKIAIVSDKPQTTRHAIRGIVTLPESQIVFIDTPGLHKPRTTLGERLNEVVRRTLTEVDAILFMLDATQSVARGDTYIAAELSNLSTPTVCVINKADRVMPPELLAQMEVARRVGPWKEILTTSALKGTGVRDVVQTVSDLLPEGPMLYPAEAVTDQPEALVVSELIREKVLEAMREEVPHSVAVTVEDMEKREDSDLIDVRANVFVERDSQKGIVIGRGGKMLKKIGTNARAEIEALLGSQIFLDLRVKVEPNWQRRKQILQRFGY